MSYSQGEEKQEAGAMQHQGPREVRRAGQSIREWTGLEPAELQPWWLFEGDNDNQEKATIHAEPSAGVGTTGWRALGW